MSDMLKHALLLIASLALPGIALSATVDELLAKHVEARGGAGKMKAIETLQLTGTLKVTGDFTAEFSLLRRIKRPGEVRTDATLQGLTSVRAWDGREGWAISPLFGRKDPKRISRDESKDMIDLADLDGPLVDAAAKGERIDYLGTEDIEGTPAHKLRVTTKDGDVQYVFLDPDYYLIIRILYQRSVRGAQVETETDFGDYEKVNGVYFPFSIDFGPKGSARTRQITIDNAEANVPLSDTLFRFPAPAP
jgi:outer membrane lipoprotein-sorting protein